MGDRQMQNLITELPSQLVPPLEIKTEISDEEAPNPTDFVQVTHDWSLQSTVDIKLEPLDDYYEIDQSENDLNNQSLQAQLKLKPELESDSVDDAQSQSLLSPNDSSNSDVDDSSKGDKKYLCPICHTAFKDEPDLKEHLIVHVNERLTKFKCSQCPRGFETTKLLVEHTFLHTGERSHECEVCYKTFSEASELNEHLDTNHIRSYECAKCNEVFTRKAHLNAHLLSRCDKRLHERHKCCKCHKTFKLIGDLNHHLCEHTKNIPTKMQYYCTECPAVFTNKQPFEFHVFLHSCKGWHNCSECPRAFKLVSELNDHLRDHTKQNKKTPTEMYNCTECQQVFTCKTDLEDHLVLRSCTKLHECLKCHKTFKLISDLNDHLCDHSNVSYNCSDCQEGFTRESYLEAHRRVHKRLHGCVECKEVFTSEAGLNSHLCVRNVKKLRDTALDTCHETFNLVGNLNDNLKMLFNCSECQAVFTHESHLTSHNCVHQRLQTCLDDLRLHECPECDEAFAEKGHLKAHLRVHSRKESYKCRDCRMTFSSISDLNEHFSMSIHNMSVHKTFYTCPKCPEVFTSDAELKSHYVVHGGESHKTCEESSASESHRHRI